MPDSPIHPPRWAAPLPDFTNAAVKRRIRIGSNVFQVLVSPVQREIAGEPDTHLVQLAVTYGGRPLAARDLGLNTPDACSNAWAYLTNRVTETVVQFYVPKPRENGELNPRLGCWGPRPDLVPLGLGDSDCAIAVVLGISIWTPGATVPVDDEVFLEALRDTVVEALSYWVVTARRVAGPQDRRN